MELVSIYHAQSEAEVDAAQALLLDAGIRAVIRRTEHIEFPGLGQVMEGMCAEVRVARTDAARARRILTPLRERLKAVEPLPARSLPLERKLSMIGRQVVRALYPVGMVLALPVYLLYELGALVVRKIRAG